MQRLEPEHKPSFFKVLIMQDFTSLLRIPHAFVRKHGDILPENVTLRTFDGKTWHVKVKEIGENSCFTEGWSKFAEDVEIQHGDISVFFYAGKSTFDVSVFEPSGVERQSFPAPTDSDSDDIVELGQFKACINRNAPVSGPSAGNGKSSTSTVKGESKAKRARISNSSSEIAHPHFKVVMKPHHKSRVHLPKKFCMDAGLSCKKSVVLEYPLDQFWTVMLDRRERGDRFCIEMTTGWSEFRTVNKLMYGKTCLFVFIPSKNVIQVKFLNQKSSQ